MSEEDEQPTPPQGFMFITPEMQQAQAQWAQAQAAELNTSMHSFLESLTGEQMHTLLRMMNIASSNPKLRLPTYWAGQLHAMLRYKHGICSHCGLALHDQLDISKFVDPEVPEAETAKVEGPPIEVSTVEQMLAFNIISANDPDHPEQVECGHCKTYFPSLAHRMDLGPKCPVCDLETGLGQAN